MDRSTEPGPQRRSYLATQGWVRTHPSNTHAGTHQRPPDRQATPPSPICRGRPSADDPRRLLVVQRSSAAPRRHARIHARAGVAFPRKGTLRLCCCSKAPGRPPAPPHWSGGYFSPAATSLGRLHHGTELARRGRDGLPRGCHTMYRPETKLTDPGLYVLHDACTQSQVKRYGATCQMQPTAIGCDRALPTMEIHVAKRCP
jgi:hypothetical protein